MSTLPPGRPFDKRADAVSGESLEGGTVDFYPEQVRRLYSLLPIGLIASAVNSVIITAVFWPVLPHGRLVIWFLCLLILTPGRFVLIRCYRRTNESAKSPRTWGRRFIAANLVSGLAWGALPIFLFPADSMPHQVFQAFVLGGMVAGAVSIFSELRLAFAAYALPAFVPVTVRFFMFSDGLHVAMAVMCSLFIVLMFMSAFRSHDAYRSLLELNVQNQLLIRKLAEKSAQDEQLTEELRNLTAHLDRVREEESKRIASEIHDQLGQSLSAAKMALTRLRNAVENPSEEARACFYSISALLETVIADVRRIARHLRPLVLDELGLGAAIEWLVDDFRERTGAACELDFSLDDHALEPDCSVAFFRILQEALTNVARHAEARHVKVALLDRGEEILLSVEDDGKGIGADYPKTQAFGILSMKERALRLHGEFQISRREPTGTVVSVRTPKSKPTVESPGGAG